MTRRSAELRSFGTTLCLILLGLTAHAQAKRNAHPDAPANSASHVLAEMTRGTLKPSETRPGDEVALRLKDDIKANGDVVVKKGTTITGVVRNVKSVDAKGLPPSMMEIEWFAPPLLGKAPRQLSIAVQSVSQVNRFNQQSQSEHAEPLALTRAVAMRNVTAAPRTTTMSNTALLNMPSVIAVDTKTASNLEASLGTSSSGQLFKVGHSEWITPGGSKQSVELFSHLSNDTMIASPGKDFEISSGAQMQLLVGVSKQ
jgi:hypothetical protein